MVYRVLACVLLALALSAVGLDAGGDKKGKGEIKKGDRGVTAGSVEIYKNKQGAYRYRVKNADGKTIAMPLPQMHWDKKEDCLRAIEELKVTLVKAKPVEVKD
jgi:uncharacterized protein YegP (UPF0339 family)